MHLTFSFLRFLQSRKFDLAIIPDGLFDRELLADAVRVSVYLLYTFDLNARCVRRYIRTRAPTRFAISDWESCVRTSVFA